MIWKDDRVAQTKTNSFGYDNLGRLTLVTFSSGAVINYSYAADGTKLREARTASGTTTTTDYTGNLVLENGTRSRLLFDGGYMSLSDNAYHYFLTDHLGSVRVVANTSGTAEEYNHYYPLGGPIAKYSTATSIQPVKYQGKEWGASKGLNLYDFGARRYDPATGRWLSQDPLSEKYYAHSPYLFCAANPVKFVDPDGKRIYIRHNGNNIEYHDNTLYESPNVEYSGRISGFLEDTVNALNSINDTEIGKQFLFGLVNSNNIIYIEEGLSGFNHENTHKAFAEEIKELQPSLYDSFDPSHFDGGSGGVIHWNPSGSLLPTTNGSLVNGITDLFHEMVHANDANLGLLNDQYIKGIKASEWRAVYYENIIRQQMGQPYRTHYKIEYNVMSRSIRGLDPYMLDSTGNPFLPNGL